MMDSKRVRFITPKIVCLRVCMVVACVAINMNVLICEVRHPTCINIVPELAKSLPSNYAVKLAEPLCIGSMLR